MQFSVTDKEIRQGLRESYTHNPVCIAVKRLLKKLRNVDLKVEIFQLDYIFIDARLFELPEQPQVLLKRFHGGEKVSPIVFDLDIPEELFCVY